MNTSTITLKVNRGLFWPKPMERQNFGQDLASAADDIKERLGLGDKGRSAVDLAAAAAIGLLNEAWNDRADLSKVGKDIRVLMQFDETWREWRVGISSYGGGYRILRYYKATSGFDTVVQAELDSVLKRNGFTIPEDDKYRVCYDGRQAVMTGIELANLNKELRDIGRPEVPWHSIEQVK